MPLKQRSPRATVWVMAATFLCLAGVKLALPRPEGVLGIVIYVAAAVDLALACGFFIQACSAAPAR